MSIQNILSIELSNFGSYRNTTKVEFPLGLTAIIGKHDLDSSRSNGVGKSTLVNSILYALYGEGEFNTLDEITNVYGKNDPMYVEIKFVDSRGNIITVTRGREKKQSYLKLYQNDVSISEKSITNTQDILNALLHMDYAMFTSSVFFEQGKLDKFINVEPSIRRQYIDKILNLDVWRNSFKLSNSKIKSLQYERKSKDEIISSYINQKTELEKELTQYQNIESEISTVQKNIEELEGKIKEAESIKTLIAKLKDYKTQLASIEESIKKNSHTLQSLNTQLEEEKLSIEKLDNQEATLKEQISEINNEIDKIEFDKESDTLRSLITTLDKECKEYNSKLVDIQSSIKNLEKQKLNISAGKCPVCAQDVSDSYLTTYNSSIENDIKLQQASYNEMLQNYNEKVKSKQDAEKQLIALQQLIQDLKSKKQVVETQIKNTQSLKEKSLNNINFIENQIKSVESNGLSLMENQINLQSVILETEKAILEQSISEEELQDFYQRLSRLKVTFNELQQKLGRKLSIEQLLEQIDDSINKEKSAIGDLVYYININQALSTIFQKIPSDLFNSSISLITQISNDLISKILPEIQVNIYEEEANNKLFIDFLVDNQPRSYKRLSGGQKTVVDLGLRLGFSQVIMTRSACTTGLVVLDEPFGALDSRNRQLVDSMLMELSRIFKQIIVISHVGDVDLYPNIITVRMNSQNISYIE